MQKVAGGFFNMDTVNSIMRINDLVKAKEYAHSKVNANPYAKPCNISKAKYMIEHSTTVEGLARGVANFMLAHPSENLKILR